jgi:hypothetical protein
LEAVDKASAEVKQLLEKETNIGWKHDHIGVLNGASRLLKDIEMNIWNYSLRRDLGRLVMDNDGLDFPESLQSLLLRISTAVLGSRS